MRKNFMRCLKQRLELAQNSTGKILFNISRKQTLKRLFKVFRNSSNSKLLYLFFVKHFYFATYFKKFSKKYANIFCVTNLTERKQ